MHFCCCWHKTLKTEEMWSKKKKKMPDASVHMVTVKYMYVSEVILSAPSLSLQFHKGTSFPSEHLHKINKSTKTIPINCTPRLDQIIFEKKANWMHGLKKKKKKKRRQKTHDDITRIPFLSFLSFFFCCCCFAALLCFALLCVCVCVCVCCYFS